MAKSPASLDLEYVRTLDKIKPYVTCIINTHYIDLIKLWLERLSDHDFPDKYLRNLYLHKLSKQIEEGVLDYPFTEPPVQGELCYFTDDDSALCSPTPKGDGDVSNSPHKSAILSSIVEQEEDTSWMTMPCDNTPPKLSEWDKQQQNQRAVIKRLQEENQQLMKIVSANDANMEIQREMHDKIIDLQKQLGGSMHRNMELQKGMHSLQNEYEQIQKESEYQRNEVELLRTKYLQTVEEHEQHLKTCIGTKYPELKRKYLNLQVCYQDRLVKHERAIQEKCTFYQQKLEEMKAKYENEQQGLVNKLEQTVAHSRSLEEKLDQTYSDVKKELTSFQEQQNSKLQLIEAEAEKKFENQYRNLLENERAVLEQHRQQIDEEQTQNLDKIKRLQSDLEEANADLEVFTNELKRLQFKFDTQQGVYQKKEAEMRVAHQKEVNTTKLRCAERLRQKEDEFKKDAIAKDLRHEMLIKSMRRKCLKQIEKERSNEQKYFELERSKCQEAIEHFEREIQQLQERLEHSNGKEESAKLAIEVKENLKTKKRCTKCFVIERFYKTKLRLCNKEIHRLQEVVIKVTNAQKDCDAQCARKIEEMNQYYLRRQKMYTLMLSNKTASSENKTNETERIIVNLEAKYKQIVVEVTKEANKSQEQMANKIAELEMRLGLSLLQKFNSKKSGTE